MEVSHGDRVHVVPVRKDGSMARDDVTAVHECGDKHLN
jgi:hypothetical protein